MGPERAPVSNSPFLELLAKRGEYYSLSSAPEKVRTPIWWSSWTGDYIFAATARNGVIRKKVTLLQKKKDVPHFQGNIKKKKPSGGVRVGATKKRGTGGSSEVPIWACG